MIILGCCCSLGFQIGETMIRGVKGSGVKITARSFKFDGDKLKYKLNYQGKGKAPDKRFDKNCEGLCIFIWPFTYLIPVASCLLLQPLFLQLSIMENGS